VVKEGGCTGLDAGVYRYDPVQHALERSFEGDVHEELTAASLDQLWVRDAAINFVVAAVYERTTRWYGDRGVRYVHMEVGHVGQKGMLGRTSTFRQRAWGWERLLLAPSTTTGFRGC